MESQELPPHMEGSEQQIEMSVEDVFCDCFDAKDFSINPHTNKIARWVFNHISFLGLLLLVSIIIVSIFTRKQFYIGNTVLDVIPIFLSMFFALWIFRHLLRKVPKSFLELAKAGRLKPSENRKYDIGQEESVSKHQLSIYPKNWMSFPGDFVYAVRNPKGKQLFIFWLIFGGVLAFFFAKELRGEETRNFIEDLWFFLNLSVAPILYAYVVSYTMWILYVIAAYIRWLTPTFILDIQPEHADCCGGLKRLGDICFEIGSIMVVPCFLLGFFFILISQIPEVPYSFIFLIYVALCVLVGFTSLAFFWPLLKIHGEMVKEKERLNDEAISRIAPVKSRLREIIHLEDAKAEEEEITNLKRKLETLEKLYPDNMKFPTWPFSPNALLVFYTTQILPIITVVKGSIEFVRFLSNSK